MGSNRRTPVLFACACIFALAAMNLQGASSLVRSLTVITQNGGRLHWSSARNILAIDKRAPGATYFDVYTINPDGTNEQCLTCTRAGQPVNSAVSGLLNPSRTLSPRHKGNPVWHPAGNWIVFQVQKDVTGPAGQTLTDQFANPGAGVNNDVFIMDAAGTQFWQVTSVAPQQGGALHPNFSRRGDMLTWAERYSAGPTSAPYGSWRLMLADFSVVNNAPVISNVRTVSQLPATFYETHGFSEDDSRIILSGNLDGQNVLGIDIYSIDWRTGQVTNLTNTPTEWDEHAKLSPAGNNIVWMSTTNSGFPNIDPINVYSDYWMMNPDGSGKVRLTFFNSQNDVAGTPTSSDYPGLNLTIPPRSPRGVTSAKPSWSPDGSKIALYMIVSPQQVAGPIVIMDFVQAAVPASSASFDTARLAPDSIVSVFARGAAPALAQAASVASLPTELNRTSVQIRDSAGRVVTAPLYFVANNQINCVLPAGLAPGTATFTVQIREAVTPNAIAAKVYTVATGTVQIDAVAPSIYTALQNGRGVAAAQIIRAANGVQTGPLTIFDNNLQAIPIDLGPAGDTVVLVLYGTGLRGRSSLANVTATVGGQTAQVLYAGPQPQYPGFDQVNVVLPRSLAGAGLVNVNLSVDGRPANSVQVAIR